MKSEKYKARLKQDIYDCLQTYGPMTAQELSVILNDRYNGNLNALTVTQFMRQMRG